MGRGPTRKQRAASKDPSSRSGSARSPRSRRVRSAGYGRGRPIRGHLVGGQPLHRIRHPGWSPARRSRRHPAAPDRGPRRAGRRIVERDGDDHRWQPGGHPPGAGGRRYTHSTDPRCQRHDPRGSRRPLVSPRRSPFRVPAGFHRRHPAGNLGRQDGHLAGCPAAGAPVQLQLGGGIRAGD